MERDDGREEHVVLSDVRGAGLGLGHRLLAGPSLNLSLSLSLSLDDGLPTLGAHAV